MAVDPYLGTMTVFGGTFTIENWAMCLGQLESVNDNPALFSLLGAMYGGDARTVFGLPDMRGRSPVGQGSRPGGMDYKQGFEMGFEQVTLTKSQLPSHTHEATFVPSGGDVSATLEVANNPANANEPDTSTYLGANSSASYFKPGGFQPTSLTEILGLTVSGGVVRGTVVVEDTGMSKPISILNPVMPLSWLISMQGVYPRHA
ncbi:MAG: tail fiber protein [Gammaproteobacteria bacterium]